MSDTTHRLPAIRQLFVVFTVPLAALFSATAHGHGAASVPPVEGDPARQIEAQARKIVFPDTADHLTLVVDLHTHTVFSDGHVWPKIRVGEALRDGLDAMAVTEHLEYQPHIADLPHPDRNRAYQETVAAAHGSDLMVIAGSEITRNEPAGHINAVFIQDANALFSITDTPADPADVGALYEAANAWPAQNAVDAAAEQGAFMFWNHPYWTAQSPDGIARMNDFHKANLDAGKLHGIEVANGKDYSAEAHAIALAHGLTLIGVSDVHDLIDWDYAPHNGGHRPVNLVLATQRTPEALRSALFAGRTLVWFKNLLIAREPEMSAMLNAALQVTRAEYRTNTQVLDVSIRNHSDATFHLRNQSDMTFMDHANRVSLAPHAVTTFSVKPGAALTEVALRFEVENALLSPTTHPSITFNVNPQVQ
ncbi:MAG: Sb-PDE family phosphodiesterase [bacterium]